MPPLAGGLVSSQTWGGVGNIIGRKLKGGKARVAVARCHTTARDNGRVGWGKSTVFVALVSVISRVQTISRAMCDVGFNTREEETERQGERERKNDGEKEQEKG